MLKAFLRVNIKSQFTNSHCYKYNSNKVDIFVNLLSLYFSLSKYNTLKIKLVQIQAYQLAVGILHSAPRWMYVATGWMYIATGWMHIATEWMHIATGWMHIATGWLHIATGWMLAIYLALCVMDFKRKIKDERIV